MKVVVVALLGAAVLTGSAAGANWTDRVKMKGDFRYRHEMIDEEGKDARNRQRLRARIGIEGQVSDRTKIVFQLASGSSDPVSTNQTLDDAFSTKQVGIDLAYFQTTHEKVSNLTLIGGKFKNPFLKPGKSELVWDSDWNPEGGAIKFKKNLDGVTLQAVGAGLWIEERSKDDDSYLLAGQAMARFHMNEKQSSIAVGGGFFNYGNAAGYPTFVEKGDSFGNSMTADSLYANDYEIMELFAEVSHRVDGIPMVAIADYVNNTAADSLETGWLVGLYVGKTKKPGSWNLRYLYREVKKDAVLGAFADSDFRGGGTDAKGHEFGGGYQLDNNMTFGVSYFVNTVGLDAAESDFNRLQVDLQLKF